MKNSSKADARPAFQWYPDDWLSETGLRLCDLSARGLWIDLLCHMFRMPERGKLRLNNRALGIADLSNIVGRPEAEVQAAVKQLIEFGVAGKDDDGTIYSRRMVRDEKQRRSKVEAGRKGGQSRGHSTTEKNGEAKGGSSTSSSSSASTSASPKGLPAADAASVSVPKKWAEEVETVTAHYLAHRPKSKQRADSKIRARLEEGFTVEDLKASIDGHFKSDYHNGKNDQGKKYLDLELMVRDAKHVEDGKGYLAAKPQRTASSSQITKSWSNPKDWEQFKEPVKCPTPKP